jgi:predicted lactoylglutathione lyase
VSGVLLPQHMKTKIFVNLPVKDLDKSMAFFKAVGFKNNPKFTDKTAACMIVTDDINVMLLTHPKFKESSKKKTIADAYKTAEVLTCLSVDSRGKVDELVDQAVAAGGSETKADEENKYEGMYLRSFDDLDGHIWEIMWMDPNGIK